MARFWRNLETWPQFPVPHPIPHLTQVVLCYLICLLSNFLQRNKGFRLFPAVVVTTQGMKKVSTFPDQTTSHPWAGFYIKKSAIEQESSLHLKFKLGRFLEEKVTPCGVLCPEIYWWAQGSHSLLLLSPILAGLL